MHFLLRRKPAITVTVTAMLLAGCAATESKLAVPYEVELTASDDVNSGGRH